LPNGDIYIMNHHHLLNLYQHLMLIDVVRKVSGQLPKMIDNIQCPVGFFYGENSIEFEVNPSVEQMQEILPEGSPIVGLKDAQHHLMLDQPHTFTENLDNLIQHLLDTN